MALSKAAKRTQARKTAEAAQAKRKQARDQKAKAKTNPSGKTTTKKKR